jgi:hypothetical protein
VQGGGHESAISEREHVEIKEGTHDTATLSTALADSLAAYVRDGDAMQQAHRLAERHGRLPRDSFTARELVADVIADMLIGESTCEPERALAPQIEREVLRRAKRLRKINRPQGTRRQALRPEFVPLEMAPANALMVDPIQGELDGDGAFDAAELVSRIRELAGDDGVVLQLLTLAERGIVLRRDVLGVGMTLGVYRAARRRLASYAEVALATVAPTETLAVRTRESEGIW